MTNHDGASLQRENGGWLGRRTEEVLISAAGLALALTLILPFG